MRRQINAQDKLGAIRFSLLTLLMLVTVAAVVCGWWLTPFEAHVSPDLGLICLSVPDPQAALRAYKRQQDAMQETCWFYRTYKGERIKHGIDALWDENGNKLFERHWRHGVLHGPITRFHPGGQVVCQGIYRRGLPVGKWTYTHPGGAYSTMLGDIIVDGVRRRIEEYRIGELVKETAVGNDMTLVGHMRKTQLAKVEVRNKEGLKVDEIEYQNGRRYGDTVGWYSNGMKRHEGTWSQGKEQGRWTWWDAKGNVVTQAEFDEGALVTETEDSGAGRLLADNQLGETVLAALHEQTFFDFWETPLTEVMGFVQDYHGIHVEINECALARKSISSEILISCEIKASPLKEALEHMLAPLGLTFVISDRKLAVTTMNDAGHSGATSARAIPSEHLVRSLQEIVSLQHADVPVRDVLDKISTTHNVVVRYEAREAQSAEIVLNQRVTFQMSGITLGAALSVILDQVDAYALTHDDALVIRHRL